MRKAPERLVSTIFVPQLVGMTADGLFGGGAGGIDQNVEGTGGRFSLRHETVGGLAVAHVEMGGEDLGSLGRKSRPYRCDFVRAG